MHPAEDDVLGLRLRGQARELERIAGDVGVGVDVGALVVVAEQDHVLAESGFGGTDAFAGVVVGEAVEAVEGENALIQKVANRAQKNSLLAFAEKSLEMKPRKSFSSLFLNSVLNLGKS